MLFLITLDYLLTQLERCIINLFSESWNHEKYHEKYDYSYFFFIDLYYK